MASWTDKNPPKFNPYIQQLPVDEMYKVGMYKQEKYDKGVEKIQTHIDNVAGMEIARDVDKTYLQSKLNELGNNLKTVAAGDFSNFQLVNSVTGMTNKIAKDKYVLNAVSSTQKYKKGLALKDKLTSEGKNGISNDWMFGTKANEWLSSNNLEEGFNTKYTPYRDYNKHAQEVLKTLVKDSSVKDIAFQYDEQGNVTGLMDAVTRVKIEGITPEKIQMALKAGLTDADWQQIQMDALYKYSNTPNEQIIQRFQSSFDDTMFQQNQRRSFLESKINSANDIDVKLGYQKRLEDLDEVIKDSKINYNKTLERLQQGDLDSTKVQMFQSDWINNFSKSHSSSETSQTIHNNPYVAIKIQRAKMEQAQGFHNDKMMMEKLKLRQRELANKLKREELEKEPDSPFGPYVGNTDEDKYKIDPVEKFKTNLDNLKTEEIEERDKYERKYIGSDLEADLEKYAKNGPNVFKKHQADVLKSIYDKSQKSVFLQNTMNSIEALADAEFKVDYKDAVPEELKNIKINLTTQEGVVSYNYAQAAEKFIKIENIIKQYNPLLGKGFRPFIKDLTNIEKNFYDEIIKKKFQQNKLSESDLKLYEIWKDEDNVISKNVNKVVDKINDKYTESEVQKKEFINEQIKSRHLVDTPQSYEVKLNEKDVKSSFIAILTEMNNTANYNGIKDANGNNVANDEILKIAGNLQSAVVNVVDKNNRILTIADDKGNSQTIEMWPGLHEGTFRGMYSKSSSEKEFENSYNVYLKNTPPDIFQIAEEDGKLKTAIKEKDYETTSLDGNLTTNWGNARLIKGVDFPNVKYMEISGNVVKHDKNSDVVNLQVNIGDPIRGGKKTTSAYEIDVEIKEEDVKQYLAKYFNDKSIFEMLYQQEVRDGKLNWETFAKELIDAYKQNQLKD